MTREPANKAVQYNLISQYFDIFKAGKKDDYSFYLGLAREAGEPVLELGCGTGRLAVELAQAGSQVTGVDISPCMLKCAQRKAEEQSGAVRRRIRLIESDMRHFKSDETYGLVIIAYDTVFQIHTAEDRLSVFSNCKKQLKPGGRLALDAWFWDNGQHSSWGTHWSSDGRMLYDGSWPDPEVAGGVIQRFRADRMDPVSLHHVRTVFCDHVAPTGEVRRFALRDDEYYAAPEQIKTELHEAGFSSVEVFGGFNHEPLFEPSLEGRGLQVFIARV